MYMIVGASGYLGSYLIKNILKYTDETIVAVARRKGMEYGPRVQWAVCDITSCSDVNDLNRTQNEILCRGGYKVIFLAACHHPDFVEKHPRLAWDVNVTALARFLNVLENVGLFFYPSTDSVYGESTEGHHFTEEEPLHPLNRYGVHKCVAEQLVLGYGYHVVRFPFLIGASILPERPHFYDQITETISNGQTMEMFRDSYRSALDFDTAAKLLIQVAEHNSVEIPRILNICGDQALSKYEIGLMIADKMGVSRKMIRPVSVFGDTGIYEARRAASTLMDNSRLKKLLQLENIRLEL